jgi:hypothetical protein
MKREVEFQDLFGEGDVGMKRKKYSWLISLQSFFLFMRQDIIFR